MTDSHDPLLDPIDDLASAHVDGQTTDAEAARIAADPSLLDRVADLAAVRAAVGSDWPVVDEDRRQASIASALAAFDEATTAGSDASLAAPGVEGPDTLTPITAAASRRRVSRRTLRLVGAAAVAVAVALAVPLLGRLDPDSGDEDVASTGLEESVDDAGRRDAEAGDTAAGVADDQAPAAEAFTLGAGAPVELGAFDDLRSLEDAVRPLLSRSTAAVQPDPSTTALDTTGAAGACTEAPGVAPPGAGPPVLTGTATLEDRAVLVFVYERSTGQRTVVVVDAGDCAVVSTSDL